MSVNLEIDDVYVWKEADPVEVSCHDYLDVTEAPEKMRLWWELNGKSLILNMFCKSTCFDLKLIYSLGKECSLIVNTPVYTLVKVGEVFSFS